MTCSPYEEHVARIVKAIRESGRLAKEDHLTMARALLALIDYRSNFPDDAEEALVRAVASVVLAQSVNEGAGICESPMEETLLGAFIERGATFVFDQGHATGVLGPLRIIPQFEVPNYRFDFAVVNDETGKRIDVEVDGHEFHERTKEQASRDKARDREVQRRGWIVFRFTGSDIYRDAMRCADEVLEHAREKAAG